MPIRPRPRSKKIVESEAVADLLDEIELGRTSFGDLGDRLTLGVSHIETNEWSSVFVGLCENGMILAGAGEFDYDYRGIVIKYHLSAKDLADLRVKIERA